MRSDAKKNYDHLLTVASDLLSKGGADASLRDIARTAGVGLGTLYRHFPTRDALLEALLRARFDELTVRAGELEKSSTPGAALAAWLRETVAIAHAYSGSITAMVAAIEDGVSPLHASCLTMRTAGAQLLVRAQTAKQARDDVDGADLFALVGALSWVADQPALASRSDRIFDIVTGAVLIPPIDLES
ncbi:AcrR family transcriptional regulator [Sphingomonas sp. UYEF23]